MQMINTKLFSLRTQFSMDEIDEKKFSKNPIIQFNRWMANAIDSTIEDPNAMTLSTAGKNYKVDSRIVLLRDANSTGFSFFTNYNSAKGKEMKENKNVCLNFFWPQLQRQIRIKGSVIKLSEKKSDAYFNSRPRESQISAWASHQSELLVNRTDLEKRYEALQKKHEGKKVPRPKHWGGYLVKPIEIEFWQGRENRLHDRLVYLKKRNGNWTLSRLNP